VAVNPDAFGFSTEYRGHDPAFEGFDEYLRLEFGKRHPGWEPRFGAASWFDPATNRWDYMYLIHGSVPDAESVADAEHKVAHLVEDIAHGLKALKPDVEKVLATPITKVWRWHH
jgi:hypothetical protein